MQREGGHPSYGHHVPMDLHVPQHFPYYAGCFMDNQGMVTAQQMQYNKMYVGIDPNGRRMDELAAHGALNPRYGQHPILEHRKEKSRDAARSRRGKENYEFYELAKMLPLPGAITSQLDKASIVRLTIAYLRLREFAAHGDPPWNRDGRFDGSSTSKGSALRRLQSRNLGNNLAMEAFEEHEGTHILQSLDGFAISLASDGRFLYISETVSIYLGLSQVELTGSSVFDYIHQSDHTELAEQLGVKLAHPSGIPDSPQGEGDEGAGNHGPAPPIPDVCYPVTSLMSNNRQDKNGKPNFDRAFCIRMKSTLTKRGCHFKSSGYRVVLLLGKLRPQYSYSSPGIQNNKLSPPIMGFIGLAIALPPPSVHEVRLETDMFVTRLTFDFKIEHCEPKVSELMDYNSEDLMGQSMYSLVHAGDVEKIKQTHTDLIKKGQVMSNYYRFMNRRGGYTWMQICATLVCNSKNSDEQSIICVNYVLSGVQHSHLIMDKNQIQVDQPPLRIKQDNLEDKEEMRNGSPESLKAADSEEYSGQNSQSREVLQQVDGAYSNDQNDPNLRLGQTSVAATNSRLNSQDSIEEKSDRDKTPLVHGQSNEKDVSSPYQINNNQHSSLPSPISPAISHPSPPAGYHGPNVTDQNSNSVKDLENAMSKHLPKEKSPSPTAIHAMGPLFKQGLQTSFSLQSYSRLAGSEAYNSLTAPVSLKPGSSAHLYSAAMIDPQSYINSEAAQQLYQPGISSFHLYNRSAGQNWYSGRH